MKKYNQFIKINEVANELDDDHLHKLYDMFVYFRENIDYLKNIWYNVKDNTREKFEIEIIWYWNMDENIEYELHRPIIEISKTTQNKTKILNHINNSLSYIHYDNIMETIRRTCLNIENFLDYKSYPNIEKIMKNKFIILDYIKFLKEFEEELEDSKSIELYNIIDNFDYSLYFIKRNKLNQIKNELKDKYEFIINAKNFNL